MTPRKAGSESRGLMTPEPKGKDTHAVPHQDEGLNPPAPPPCEICEQYRMEDARWILESHINGLHQELAALTAENSKLREVMGAQVKVHAHRRYHRSSHPTCGVCITDDEARALLTEEGKP